MPDFRHPRTPMSLSNTSVTLLWSRHCECQCKLKLSFMCLWKCLNERKRKTWKWFWDCEGGRMWRGLRGVFVVAFSWEKHAVKVLLLFFFSKALWSGNQIRQMDPTKTWGILELLWFFLYSLVVTSWLIGTDIINKSTNMWKK